MYVQVYVLKRLIAALAKVSAKFSDENLWKSEFWLFTPSGGWLTLDTRVDLNILKIQSNKLLLFGGKFGINRYAH